MAPSEFWQLSPQEFWRLFDLRKPVETIGAGGMTRPKFERMVADLHDPNWGKKRPREESHAGDR